MNRQFLGAICDCTLVHLVARLANREPITTWGALRQIWLLPYGLPLEIVCDIDGAFQG